MVGWGTERGRGWGEDWGWVSMSGYGNWRNGRQDRSRGCRGRKLVGTENGKGRREEKYEGGGGGENDARVGWV